MRKFEDCRRMSAQLRQREASLPRRSRCSGGSGISSARMEFCGNRR